ncbi:hypothetical protein CAJAP_09390 [Camponotus japonicus]
MNVVTSPPSLAESIYTGKMMSLFSSR